MGYTSPSVESFKTCLKEDYPQANVLYYYGQRWPQVHHARMRLNCSKLKADLFYHLHVEDSPRCECGNPVEDVDHFLLKCPIYRESREIMLNQVIPICVPTSEVLLYGNPELNFEDNITIFAAVHSYLQATRRFA